MPEEEKKKDKKDENKVVLEARLHCESCRSKVRKSISDYPGVEEIIFDDKKVTVKGKVDARNLFETAKKRSGNKVTKLLYPEPKKEDNKNEDEKEEKKKEPADVTVVLKVQIHCGECAEKVRKTAKKIAGVYDVKVDGDKLTLKGKDLDAKKVCEEVKRKSGKYAEVVPPKKDDKKDGENKDGANKEGESSNKKEDKQGANFKVTAQYVYAPQYFSDENPNACFIM